MLCHSSCALKGLFVLNWAHAQLQAAHLWSAVLRTLSVTETKMQFREWAATRCKRVRQDLRFLKRKGNKTRGEKKKKREQELEQTAFSRLDTA